MRADVYNLKNEKVSEIELPAKLFGVQWKPEVVRQVLLAQLANARRPWAHAKDRSEVRGGGRKPWRQKGTGRARHGSIRSPIWRGGGKAHGPTKFRDYSQKVNKKMGRLALASALSKKFKDGEVKIFESLDIAKPKTKTLTEVLRHVLAIKKNQKKFDTLLLINRESVNTKCAASNLVKTKALNTEALNLYDILNYKNIFIDEGALRAIVRNYPSPLRDHPSPLRDHRYKPKNQL